MERNSIIISIMVLWSAVVFILNQTCQTGWCDFLSTLCIFFLLLSNLVFIVVGGRNFFRLLLQRIEKGKERRLREASVAGEAGAIFTDLDFITNPALGCNEVKTKSETIYTENGAFDMNSRSSAAQSVELTVLSSPETRPRPPSNGAAFHAPPTGPSPHQRKGPPQPPPPKRSLDQPKRPQRIQDDPYGYPQDKKKGGCLQWFKCCSYGYVQHQWFCHCASFVAYPSSFSFLFLFLSLSRSLTHTNYADDETLMLFKLITTDAAVSRSCAGCFWLAQDYGG
jgi:hypothetical protein